MAVPDPGKDKDYSKVGAMQIYVNTADTRIQRSDPRPPPIDADGPMPPGWEKHMDDGEPYVPSNCPESTRTTLPIVSYM